MRSIRRIAAALSLVVVCVGATVGCSEGQAAVGDFDSLSPPQASILSTDESDALLQQQLDHAWSTTGAMFDSLQRPDVAVVRTVSADEWAPAIVACMDAVGYTAHASEDGSFQTGSVDPAIAESYYAQLYVCNAEYPVDAKYMAPLNDAQVRYLYAYFRDELTPCIEAAGYSPEAAPSYQAFSEGWTAGGSGWTPYTSVAPPSQQEWLDLQRRCPQFPDGLY